MKIYLSIKCMKYRVTILFLFCSGCCISSLAQNRQDILYQVGLPSTFMSGMYNGILSISELKKHGDFGLGAPDKLDGELIMENSRMYQTRFTGKTSGVNDSATTCLSMVCFFKPDLTVRTVGIRSGKEAFAWLDSLLTNKNGIYAIRITGEFEYLQTRAFPPVIQYPYPDITTLMPAQHYFEMHKIHGMMVGFRSPAYMESVTIPGFHFHFLSDEKDTGGHVTGFTWNNATIEIEELHQFQLELPRTTEFHQFQFQKNRSEDLKKLENGGKLK